MEHYCNNNAMFGEEWFNYHYLYQTIVKNSPPNAWFVEVGSYKGRSAAYMAVEIINSGKNIFFDCIDIWDNSKFTDALLNKTEEQKKEVIEEDIYKIFLRNIMLVRRMILPIRGQSDEIAKYYADKTLDFVFIDASHQYEDVLRDIKAWYPKVKTNGIIAGHDYNSNQKDGWTGVNKAVHEFFENKKIEVLPSDIWLHLKLE